MSVFGDITRSRLVNDVVILDGGTGTELEARGGVMHDDAWSAIVTLKNPGLVREVHTDYIRAGAQIVGANTFMAGEAALQRAGLGDEFGRVNEAAVRLAQEARDAAAEQPVAIAGCVSLTASALPDLESLSTQAGRTRTRDAHLRHVELLVKAGADLIAVELGANRTLVEPGLDAALQSGLPVWLGLSFDMFDGELVAFDGSEAASTFVEGTLRPGIDSVAIMHTELGIVSDAISTVRQFWDGPLAVYPHHGRWQPPHWVFDDLTPETFTQAAAEWRALGAWAIGGCCGVRPAHIAALAARVRAAQE